MMMQKGAARVAALILAVALLAAAAPAAAMNPSTTTGEWFGVAPIEGAPKNLFAAPQGEAVNSVLLNSKALGIPLSGEARGIVKPAILAVLDAANTAVTPLAAAPAAVPAPTTTPPSDTFNAVPAIVPVPHTGPTQTRVVRKGDSIWGICQEQPQGCNWPDYAGRVVGLNKLTTPSHLAVGQKLVLPVTTSSAKPAVDTAGVKELVGRRTAAVKNRDEAKVAADKAAKELEAAGEKVSEAVKALLNPPASGATTTTPSLGDALVAVQKAAEELTKARKSLAAAEAEVTASDAAITAVKDSVSSAVKTAEETKNAAAKAETEALKAAEKAAEQVGAAVKAALAPPAPPATTPSLSTAVDGLNKAAAALAETRAVLKTAEKALQEVQNLQKSLS